MNERDWRDLVKKYFEVAPKMPRDVTKGDILQGMVINAARSLADAYTKGEVIEIMVKVGDVSNAIRDYDAWLNSSNPDIP